MVTVLFITSIRCQDRVNDYFCVCPAGYEGKNCSTNIDDCVTNGQPCKNGATCTDKVYTIIKSKNNFTADRSTEFDFSSSLCNLI